MTTLTLIQQLAEANAILQTQQQNQIAQMQELATLKRNLPDLENEVLVKECNIRNALTQAEMSATKQALELARENVSDSMTLIANLDAHIKHSTLVRDAEKAVEEAQTALMEEARSQCISQFQNLSADQQKALKDFVVLNQMMVGRHQARGLGLGAVVTEVFGELREKNFEAHRQQLLSELFSG